MLSTIIFTLATLLYSLLSVSAQDAGASPNADTPAAAAANGKKPNIVFILTDDQDKLLDSMDYMETVKKELIAKGTEYDRHYCQVSLCCPSRVTLLTGKAAHNTKVTDLVMPYGGYERFIQQGLNNEWIAPWLQKAGYKTYYTGKLMNDHTKGNYDKPFPGGLDGNDFLVGPGTYSYLNPLFQHNRDPPQRIAKYATDVLAEKSNTFIREGARSAKPFFIMIATVAPHSTGDTGRDDEGEDSDSGSPEADDSDNDSVGGEQHAPIPAARHKDLFPNVQVPRKPNFNPEEPSGASWVRAQKRRGEGVERKWDNYHRRRLQALQAVDDLVKGTIETLRKEGVLDNTFIVYSTDNGFHIGQHRLQPGKRCPYEESINIPLVIRGPGVPAGKKEDAVSSHVDLVPTILGWAGAKMPGDLDGQALVTGGGVGGGGRAGQEHTQVEHWGIGERPTQDNKYKHPNSTYKAVRVIGDGYNLYYSLWCSDEHELYDMIKDPYQMKNVYGGDGRGGGGDGGPTFDIGPGGRRVTLKQLEDRLDTLLLVLKDCKGDTCRQPWKALHPRGGVSSLREALKEEYDQFYGRKQKRVKFQECTPGYLPAKEGGVGFEVYGGM